MAVLWVSTAKSYFLTVLLNRNSSKTRDSIPNNQPMIADKLTILINHGRIARMQITQHRNPVGASRTTDEPQIPAIAFIAIDRHHLHVCQASIPVMRDGIVGISGINSQD